MTDRSSKVYGLIGFPLTHSFSQTYFSQKFESEGIDACYLNFELPDIGDLMEALAEYPRLAGLNVTLPYKQKVLPYLDEIDPVAAEIGAVNVIKIDWSGDDVYLKGFNSDVVGFVDSIRPLLTPEREKALVLGTGGASKAVVKGLRDLGVEPLCVSRRPGEGVITYADLTAEVMAKHKVIVNTTPVGMYPHTEECPDIPYDLLAAAHLCYDLTYNPEVTMFMRRSSEHGATVKNGLEMLLIQAQVAWKIWNS